MACPSFEIKIMRFLLHDVCFLNQHHVLQLKKYSSEIGSTCSFFFCHNLCNTLKKHFGDLEKIEWNSNGKFRAILLSFKNLGCIQFMRVYEAKIPLLYC